jgi:hypothetical protein
MRRFEVSRPWLHADEVALASKTIESGWVTQGPQVAAFEKKFAEYTGAAYAVAVSSCTTALHLSLLAVGVKPGDIVVTVSHSFIATANSIRHAGAEPYFIDVDEQDSNLDVLLLHRFLTERCRSTERGLGLTEDELIRFKKAPSPLSWVKDELVGSRYSRSCSRGSGARQEIRRSGSRRCRLCHWFKNRTFLGL